MSVCECIHCTQIRINFKEGAAVSWYSAFPCQWEGPESQIPFFNINGRAHPKSGTGCYITRLNSGACICLYVK